MKKSGIILTALLFAMLTACATLRVHVNYDDTLDFKQYKTYAYAKPQQKESRGSVNNRLFTQDVMQEIDPSMQAKGFTRAASRSQADLLIIFYASIKNRKEWVSPTYRRGRWGRVHRVSPGHTVRYKEGTLVVDIVNRTKEELVWQGVGQGVLNRSNPGEHLAEAVKEVLKDFPPNH